MNWQTIALAQQKLAAMYENDGEPWAKALAKVLRHKNMCVHRARAAGKTALPRKVLASLEACYDRIVMHGLRRHEAMDQLPRVGKVGSGAQRTWHNLLQRLYKYKTDTLLFMHNFAVPSTNNLAEQDIRMMKVKIKISGGFRSSEGAEDFAALRSVISTARKRGCHILETLRNAVFFTVAPA
jgi:transposase